MLPADRDGRINASRHRTFLVEIYTKKTKQKDREIIRVRRLIADGSLLHGRWTEKIC